MKQRTIENRFLSLSLDAGGRIVSLKNKLTGTELITHADVAEAWRMIVPTGRHSVDIVSGARQKPKKIELLREEGKESLVVTYDSIAANRKLRVKARFVLSLEEDAKEILAYVELDNRSDFSIDEVEFPVLGGLGGFPVRGKKPLFNLVAAGNRGNFYPDVLEQGLPDTGRESNHFVREHETCMFETVECDGTAGLWLDLWCDKQGLFFGYFSKKGDFAFKLEKFPKEVPSAPVHYYPKGTRRWLRVFALHVPRVKRGESWRSETVRIMPHEGDWHVGADRFSAYRHEVLKPAEPPSWMEDFVGWTELLGKTYLGEVFHDYARCANAVVRDKRVTGLDLVFYYGDSRIGAEGADFDHSPAPDLGGREGFLKMVNKLHRNGIRIILLDHFHRWVNRDIPEYKALDLAKHAIVDMSGRHVTARWWKETYLSCRRLSGPTPVWVEMCPSSKKWLEYYLDHVTKTIALGVDGLELDTFEWGICHSTRHNHRPGENMYEAKLAFMRAVRAHAKRLNPDFVLIGETMVPEAREVFDGFYSSRFLTEQERIYRYLYPEIRQQTVMVSNYAYDQVNKGLSLGVGINTEIWGLRKTALDGCPELARYIGEVNTFRRRYPDILMRGKFKDTVGATVKGDCLYSVLEGPNREKALVLRNHSPRRINVQATFRRPPRHRLVLWRPFAKERTVARLPVRLTLKPYEAAVVLALSPRSGSE